MLCAAALIMMMTKVVPPRGANHNNEGRGREREEGRERDNAPAVVATARAQLQCTVSIQPASAHIPHRHRTLSPSHPPTRVGATSSTVGSGGRSGAQIGSRALGPTEFSSLVRMAAGANST